MLDNRIICFYWRTASLHRIWGRGCAARYYLLLRGFPSWTTANTWANSTLASPLATARCWLPPRPCRCVFVLRDGGKGKRRIRTNKWLKIVLFLQRVRTYLQRPTNSLAFPAHTPLIFQSYAKTTIYQLKWGPSDSLLRKATALQRQCPWVSTEFWASTPWTLCCSAICWLVPRCISLSQHISLISLSSCRCWWCTRSFSPGVARWGWKTRSPIRAEDGQKVCCSPSHRFYRKIPWLRRSRPQHS